jgi:excisionase family DNA binding protein
MFEMLAIPQPFDEERTNEVAPVVAPLVVTIEEAARCLGVGRTLMYALVKSGEVESVRIRSLRRVPVDALARYVAVLRGERSDAAG